MPDHRKYCNQVGQRLRDDLLAQLRMTRRPMSTSELRDKAPPHPLRAGSAVTVAPLQEQVYRALCVLRVHGKVEQHRSEGRTVSWVAASQVSSAPAPRDTPRPDPTVYRMGALLIVVGITLTMLLYLMVYAFAGGFAPTNAVQCQAAATVRSTSSPLPQALR